MLARRIIPCLDVTDGHMGPEAPAGLGDDPVELARFYSAAGADELLIIDRTPTSDRANRMEELLHSLAEQVFLPLIIGGGIEAPAQARSLLRAGADRVVLHGSALRHPELIGKAAALVGRARVVVKLKVRLAKSPEGDGATATTGARDLLDERGKPDPHPLLEMARTAVDQGAGELLLVDTDRVGTDAGFDVELVRSVTEAVPGVPVLVQGGARLPGHFVTLFGQTQAAGAVASGIFHYLDSSIKRIKRDCADAGLPIRPLPLEEEGAPATHPEATGNLPHADVPTPPGPTRRS